jgi:hypothetical protein
VLHIAEPRCCERLGHDYSTEFLIHY